MDNLTPELKELALTEQFQRFQAVVDALKLAEPIPDDTTIQEQYAAINVLISAYEDGEFEDVPSHFSDVLDNCNMLAELNIYLARLVLHKWKIPNPWPEGYTKFIKQMSVTLVG